MVSEEDEDDWSDVSELQEIDLKQLQTFKDQNGNINKKTSEKGQYHLIQRAAASYKVTELTSS